MAALRGEEAAAQAPAETLSQVFPGEAVELRSIGRTVVVSEWGARALVQEVPAKLGRIMGRLGPLAGQLRGAGIEQVLPPLFQAAGQDIADLVLWSAGVEPEALDRLTAGELVRLTAAVVRQNRDFFAGLWDLYALLGRELPGSASPPR